MTSPADTSSQAVSPSLMGPTLDRAMFPAGNRRANSLLLRAEHAIAGVAEPGDDIALLVEPLVDRRGVDRAIWMRGVKHAQALGHGQQAHELDRARPGLLDPRDRRSRRVAGREHRIDDDHVA